MFAAGDTLGPYTIVRRLGAGAMGEVYQARHRHMGRDAAIKVLRAELTEEADVVNRFFTEARATAAVRHPGIVEIFDCDLHRTGRAFIVMEYLAGEDLAQRLGRAGAFAPDWPALRAIGRQLASALAAAHAIGIVHRDLKPGNIFLVAQDAAPGAASPAASTVKIVDFGIAKLLHRDGGMHSQTQTGHILGTPLYMSPEQARGAKTIDHRTDIYALGCVLFEMITGQPPFVRKGPAEVIVAHLHDPVPRASSLEATVPAALDELVAAMLAKSVDARPQSMTQVLERLAEPPVGHVATKLLVGGKGSGPVVAAPVAMARAGRDAQVLARAGSTTLGNSAAELVAETEHVAPRGRRQSGVVVGIAVAAVLVVGGVAVVARSGAHTVPEPIAATAPAAAPEARAPSPPAAPAKARITITSQPPGAEIWIGDEPTARGNTPLSLELPVAAPATRAVLRLAGREPVPITLDANDTGARHVVLPPVVVPAPVAKPAAVPGHRRHAKSEGEFKAIED
jgi:tRNA A-37 threonylcarbamoyl transferase component Bud32